MVSICTVERYWRAGCAVEADVLAEYGRRLAN